MKHPGGIALGLCLLVDTALVSVCGGIAAFTSAKGGILLLWGHRCDMRGGCYLGSNVMHSGRAFGTAVLGAMHCMAQHSTAHAGGNAVRPLPLCMVLGLLP